MKSIHKYWLVAGVLFATITACEDENTTTPGGGAAGATGGGSGAAGKAGSGAASGSAGIAGKAGASGSGGASGSSGTGGSAGAGGAGTGGTGGAAGTAGKGGAAGSAGAAGAGGAAGTGGMDGGAGAGGSAGTAGAGGSAGTAGAGGNDGGLPDSGTGGTAGGTPDSGPPDVSDGGGITLPPHTVPINPGKAGILFSVSGETLAMTGYPFPPADPSDLQFYDGWEVMFDRLIVTVDNLTLSANPDTDMGDQSKTGAAVATVKGPWAIDLHRDGPNNIPGKSPGERAAPIAALSKQSNGNPFLTNGTRYAFAYDAIAATATAMNVNLDAAALADYAEMIQNACAVFYVGTATFKGDTTCNAGHTNWPTPVKFRLCFKTPSTYVNCQNPDNMGTPFPNEEFQRGIAFDANAAVIGQITFHAEHPFWDSVLHDSPAHFDQFAARVVGQDGGTPTVTLESTKGVDYTAYRDSLNNAIQWRYCTEPPTDVHAKFLGPMAFDPQSVPHATNNDPVTGLRDYYDFAAYNQSTEGHLNADGLCYVRRNYPSPP